MSSMSKRIFSFSIAVFVLAVVWGIWNESFSTKTMAQGVVLGALALVITNRFLLRAPWPEVYRISPVTLVRYVAVLLVEIFRSGVHAIYVTVTDRINVGVVDLPASAMNELEGVLVANAITLTPGTVTVDYDRTRFKVIWIDCVTDDPDDAAEEIKGSFERVFLREKR